ncbi:hypothetical protein XBFM1_1260042 [Xenorhabdus bovienii str. feltiae Moldova]|uniref:Phage protein n=1 Tax=Xenorhabdus bovienii str. feltiae Moldova TaxID=1398200 RepID=A0A077NN89_XENBV|nr:hypothetical protein XBFM1_1260042 [Xenorhabdus bovienii str. feltiae Moldova]
MRENKRSVKLILNLAVLCFGVPEVGLSILINNWQACWKHWKNSTEKIRKITETLYGATPTPLIGQQALTLAALDESDNAS